MWKFLEGAKPPPEKKIKRTVGEKMEAGKIYEKERRVRKWNEKWMLNDDGERRSWLLFVKGENMMYCTACKDNVHHKMDKASLFALGTSNFKLESIKEHETSRCHQHLCRVATAKLTPVESSDAHKAVATLNKAQYLRMEKLFQTAHALAKKGRPFSDFSWMCE